MKESTDQEDSAYVLHLLELDKELRYAILNQALTLEHILGRNIANILCSDINKRNMFYSLIITDQSFTLSKKLKIFISILDLAYPNIYSGNKKLFKTLRKLIERRNLLSHSNLLITDEIKKMKKTGVIYYSQYEKNNRVHVEYSIDDFKKEHMTFSEALESLLIIEKEIKKQEGVDDEGIIGDLDRLTAVKIISVPKNDA